MATETKQFDDNMTGILGKNDYKQEAKHPDKRGRAKIRGIWFWISAWEKQGQSGSFDSLAFTEMTADEAAKYEAKSQARANPQPQQGSWGSQQQQQPAPQQQQAPQQSAPAPSNEPPMDFDDDIPF